VNPRSWRHCYLSGAVTRWTLWVVTSAALVGVACCRETSAAGGVKLSQYPHRVFPTLKWDTLVTIGAPSANDTMLLNPSQIVLWGSRIAALDWANKSVRVFSRATGHLLWKYERTGQGPGELTCISDGVITPASRLWVVDGCANRKVLELDTAGVLLREIHPRALPPSGWDRIAFVGRRALVTTQLADQALIWAEPDSLTPEQVEALPWPDSLDSSYRLDFDVASAGARGPVVLAYELGPAFVVLNGDSVRVHPYIDRVHFMKKPNPLRPASRPDSMRYAAITASIVGDEVFFLFGGRPRRREYPAKPTLLIDVYGLTGAYRRSYLLPVDTRSMATEDGQVFWVIEMSEGLYPEIMALRPRSDFAN